MFDYINGFISDKRKTSRGCFVTVDVNGVGYLAEISERDFEDTSVSDSVKQKIYLHLVHREDAMILYGFLIKEMRDIFQILLSVSGVGAKMAIALLNEFDACDLISLVINENYKELTRAKGVGPKLAQKIILELKDKLIKTDLPKSSNTIEKETPEIGEAKSVLLSLGYGEDEIAQVMQKCSSAIDDTADTEEILRKALLLLSV